jgi:hypothetical protein
MLERPPSRQARYRRRQRAGEVMVTLSVSPEVTARLAQLGYLGEHELEDRAAIANAIVTLIANIKV